MGAMTLNLTRCLFFIRKPVNINVLRPAVPKIALVPPSCYYYDINKSVILQCLCQVSLGFKVVQMGAYDFKLKKVHPFAQRPVNINVLRSAAPKLALVPASRYNCHI